MNPLKAATAFLVGMSAVYVVVALGQVAFMEHPPFGTIALILASLAVALSSSWLSLRQQRR